MTAYAVIKERCSECGTAAAVVDIAKMVILAGGRWRSEIYCQGCGHRWWIER